MFPGKRYQPGGFPRPLMRALQQEGSILVLSDVPPSEKRETHDIKLFGHAAKIDPGMFDLFIQRKAFFVTYKIRFDFLHGHRFLDIVPVKHTGDPELYWLAFDEFVSSTLMSDSTQWNLWQVANSYFHHIRS
jgi:hypothetical protein